MPLPATPSNLKGQVLSAVAKTEPPLLQSVCHDVRYRPGMCRATNGVRFVRIWGTKKI